MNYEEKYKKALSFLKDLKPHMSDYCIEKLEGFFPELRESEDERIRNEIIAFVEQSIHRGGGTPIPQEQEDKWIAWLEKQGEQKPIDESKPKFKVGDWITTVNDEGGIAIEKVVEFLGNKVRLIDTDGVYMLCPQGLLNHYHLWTIQDAKDGDILMANAPFIFNGNLEGGIGCPGAHCGINSLGKFQIPKYQEHWTGHTTTPATKEQCDLLFYKMKEAGYEWDNEKKELKKIEFKTDWSEDDEKMKSLIISTLTSMGTINLERYHHMNLDEVKNWLKSIKDRVQPQPKQEWSEEDERRLNHLIGFIQKYGFEYYSSIDKVIDWLKSHKPQNRWKPSEEQMEALDKAKNNSANYYDIRLGLQSLYNDLIRL